MTTPDEEITGYGGIAKTGSTTPQADRTIGSGTPHTATPSSPGYQAQTGSAQGGRVGSDTPPSEDLKAKARQAAEQVQNQGKAHLDSYRGTAADELEKVAQSAKAAAAELENQDRADLSRYVADMAQGITRFADDLRGRSVDELVGDLNRMARNNPALFIAGSVALGFGLTRFARASSHRPAEDYHRPGQHDERYTGSYGDSSHLPSQSEINEHIASGEPRASVGSLSNTSTATSSPTPRSNGLGTNGKGTNGGLVP